MVPGLVHGSKVIDGRFGYLGGVIGGVYTPYNYLILMKINRCARLGLKYPILLVLLLFISACGTKLVDIDKSVPMLDLSEEQLEVVKPKMIAIRNIVDTYTAKKEQLEAELNNRIGSDTSEVSDDERRSNRRETFEVFRKQYETFRKQREAYLSAVTIHINEIKAVLDEEQLAIFEKMKMPELEMPEMPNRGGRGERSGRGGMKGGGGRRGGGMF